MSLMSFSVDSTGRAGRAKWGRADITVDYKPEVRSGTPADHHHQLAGDFGIPRPSSTSLSGSGLHLKQQPATMTYTGSSGVSSPSSSYAALFSTPSPALSSHDQFSSTAPFLSLKLQAQFQDALRSMTSRPPISPQESSNVALSSPRTTVPTHPLLQKEPCVQSHVSPPSLFADSSYRSPTSAFNRDIQLSDLPIVRGPAAFQSPCAGSSLQAGDSANVVGISAISACAKGKPLCSGRSTGEDECKRLKRTLEDLERELMGEDTEVVSSVLDSEPPVVSEPPERDWTDVIEDLLSSEDSSFPLHTVDAGSKALLDYSTVTGCCNSGENDRSLETSTPKFAVSNKEASIVQSFHSASNVTLGQPKQLLVACASAIDADNFEVARSFLASLRDCVSISGNPMERLAAYMADGLAARIESFCEVQHRSVKFQAAEIIPARRMLDRCCPFYKFGSVAANGAIAEAFQTEMKVHIIDFNVGQGIRWQGVLEDFARRPGGPPYVRITVLDDPTFPANDSGSLECVGRRLKEFAQEARVPLEFNAVSVEVSHLQPWMLEKRPGEALAVNFAFQLHHMPDESVSTMNPRDRLVRFVRAMEPKLVILVEREASTNTAPFYPRFVEALNYFAAVFDSLDATLPRDSRDRINVEQMCLARDIVNIIACEGADRTERYELAGKWRVRMTMAGFRPLPLSSSIQRNLKDLLHSYSHNYRLREETGCVFLDWLDRALVGTSAWQ